MLICRDICSFWYGRDLYENSYLPPIPVPFSCCCKRSLHALCEKIVLATFEFRRSFVEVNNSQIDSEQRRSTARSSATSAGAAGRPRSGSYIPELSMTSSKAASTRAWSSAYETDLEHARGVHGHGRAAGHQVTHTGELAMEDLVGPRPAPTRRQ